MKYSTKVLKHMEYTKPEYFGHVKKNEEFRLLKSITQGKIHAEREVWRVN